MDNGSNADSGGSGCGCLLVAGLLAYFVLPVVVRTILAVAGFLFQFIMGLIGVLLQLTGLVRQ